MLVEEEVVVVAAARGSALQARGSHEPRDRPLERGHTDDQEPLVDNSEDDVPVDGCRLDERE